MIPSVLRTCPTSPTTLAVGVSIVLGWLSVVVASSSDVVSVAMAPARAVTMPIGQAATNDDDQLRSGHLIKVRLPIDDRVKDEVRASLEAVVKTAPLAVRPDQRAIVVLEFDTRVGKTGRGSDREACQSLARTLMGRRFNSIQTIAYVPASQAINAALDENGTVLSGHAVLVALATNQLALAPNTSIGDAGIDEPEIDELLSTIYRTLPGQRRRLPEPMVASMLDSSLGLARVEKKDKTVEYVGMAELKAIEAKQLLDDTKVIANIGQPAVVSAEDLKVFGLINLVPKTKKDLERALRLEQGALKYRLSASRSWNAIELQLPYSVDEKAERWFIRSLNRSHSNDVNMVVVTIDESVGNPTGCLAIAQQLAELRKDDIQTVAFVRGKALGAVGIIALACDHLIMSPNATLGGFDSDTNGLEKSELDQLRPSVKQLATLAEKDWSIMMAMLDPGLVVTQYKDTEASGQVRLMTNDEVAELGDDLNRWQPGEVLVVSSGLNSKAAERFGLTRYIAEDLGQLQAFYQLSDSPKRIELSSAERWIDQIANFFRDPVIGMFLLMGAFMFISNEVSAPGLGVPGFLGTLCVVLYFWSHWFGGETEVFEILMFVVGLGFIIVEIFVVPGFGIFGIGGILLVAASIVLAGQDFVVPMTGKDWAQVPYSLMPVAGAGLGVVGAVFFLQAAIEKSPFFSQFVLDTNERQDTGLNEGDPEATADWGYLLGKEGTTITRLNPSGKARIDGSVYDVISTGLMVDKATAVEVVEAVANRIVVQVKES